MKKYYNSKQIANLIQKYIDLGGEVTEIQEGVLGHGELILHSAPKKRTIIVKEVAINAWSSLHTIRQYNDCPKKYQKYIN